MKARPRSVERRVAQTLTEIFSGIGKSPVHRIPVLGRTGPDITINEVGLVIDVKSRGGNPDKSFAPLGKTIRMGDLIGFRLEELLTFAVNKVVDRPLSTTVLNYFYHMEEWTASNSIGNISAVILHKPRMPIGNSTVIIYEKEITKLCHRLQSS